MQVTKKQKKKELLRKYCGICNGSSWGKKEERRVIGKREKTKIIIP